MLALLESDRPDGAAVFDLARSCVRTWFHCRLPAADFETLGPPWLVALRLMVQLPAVLATVVVVLGYALALTVSVLQGRAGDLGAFGMITGPIAVSGMVAIYLDLSGWGKLQAAGSTLVCVAAALLAMVAALASVAVYEPHRVGPLLLLRLPIAYALLVGLTVRFAFRGIPWKRCVVNCVHESTDSSHA